MANQEDKYIPPTEEQLYKSVYAPGNFVAKCKKCGVTIKATTVEELKRHKCYG